jgi:hypothetical protein
MDQRSKGWQELRGHVQPVEADQEETVADLVQIEPRCEVCTLPGKPYANAERVAHLIQKGVLQLLGFKQIQDLIKPEMEAWPVSDQISYDSIRNHAKRHLPVDQILVREIAERRAEAAGRRVLEGAEPLLTSAALYELTMRRGFERLARGETQPTLKEALTAASLLDQLEAGAGEGSSIVELRAQLQIIVDVIQRRVGREVWNEIAGELRALGTGDAAPTVKPTQRKRKRRPDGQARATSEN